MSTTVSNSAQLASPTTDGLAHLPHPDPAIIARLIDDLREAIGDENLITHHDELVVVVFHADPIKLAVAYYLDLSLDNFQRLQVNTGSVTILKMVGSSKKLLGLNLIPPYSSPKS